MGNIYFEQHKYPSAIKMYRMALDQVPLTSRSVRSKILRNIGVAFMRVGQYQVLPSCALCNPLLMMRSGLQEEAVDAYSAKVVPGMG